ncbi:hypothetical protein Q5752_003629 [Cryptotrichosporon argae]
MTQPLSARRIAGAATLGLLALPSTSALWPFQQKRFTAETLINAGPLGLADVKGRVVAVGDWNGDQNLDVFTLSDDGKTIQLHLWDRGAFAYEPSHSLVLSSKVTNVVPGDFNHDGHLDLLVMSAQDGGWWGGGSSERMNMQVYLGGTEGFAADPWLLNPSTLSQPIVFDANGSLKPSLLGFDTSDDSQLRTWLNSGTGFIITSPPLSPAGEVCTLANPHSSAFVDIDGDCLPDLVLHCQRSRQSSKSIQIWLNRGSAGFVLGRTYNLPSGSGPLSFADMNECSWRDPVRIILMSDRDGSLDVVFPTCERVSSSSGVGTKCSINIAYNKQVPICSSEGSRLVTDGKLQCRGWGELCQADDSFDYSFDDDSDYFVSIPLLSIITDKYSSADLLLSVPNAPEIPLPLRPGDYDVDGFPDLLVTISNSTAAPSGSVFGGGRRTGTQPKVLRNVACGKGVAGCDVKKSNGPKGKRGLKAGEGKGWEALDEIWDASGASWIDVDDDGSLDIMVQRTGEQAEQKVAFVQNNFYHDAFFLKAQVLNGACDGKCQPAAGGKAYSALGVSYPGATFKFTVLDTNGHRRAQQIVQLPQTGYHALNTPYAFFGLGRTNNYVENLFVGSSLHPPGHTTNLESLIPNSQVIINPPAPGADSDVPDSDQSVKARSHEWKSELFLHPGDWVPVVGAAVVGCVMVLGAVVVWLNEREKNEDEKDRRRALHAINFQAL